MEDSIFDKTVHDCNQFILTMKNNFILRDEIVLKVKEYIFSNAEFGHRALELEKKYNELGHSFEVISKKESKLIAQKQILIEQTSCIEDDISCLSESIEHLETAEQKLKNEKDKFKTELLKKHQALKLSVYFYKSGLNFHVAFEKHNDTSYFITLHFFTHDAYAKEYSVKLLRDDEENIWELNDMNPKIAYGALKQRLMSTKDIIGFIVTVRDIFKKIRFVI